jgi:hypothetical protein
MTRHRFVVPVVAIVAFSALDIHVARAQTHDPAAGEALFQEGRRLMKNRDFAPACAKFEESLRLDPATGTLMNLADCEEQLGHTASAWQHWRAAADQLPVGDKRRTTAVSRATGLEKVLARLSVALAPSAPPDAVVKRDGVLLGAASLGVALPVDPGHHVVIVSAAGRENRETEVTMHAKEQRSLIVEAGAPSEAASGAGAEAGRPSSTPPPPPASARTSPGEGDARAVLSVSSERRAPIAGYALLGVGVLGVAAGTYFGLTALTARRDASAACPDVGGVRRCLVNAAGPLDRDKRNSLYADIGFGVGIVAAGAGLYLLLKPQQPEPPATAGFAPLPGGGEVHVAGHF